jgi:hypothetical protein
VATIRFTYPRTGDQPTDRALDLIVSQLNQLAALMTATGDSEDERRARLEDAKAIASLHP